MIVDESFNSVSLIGLTYSALHRSSNTVDDEYVGLNGHKAGLGFF